jgi:hypothetical protein
MARHFRSGGGDQTAENGPGQEVGEYISEREVAKRTGIKVQTLRNWRHLRRGFKYVRLGERCIRYHWQDIVAYLDARKIDPEGTDHLS